MYEPPIFYLVGVTTMRKFSKKQYLVAGVAAAAVIGLGTGTAIAYWTAGGSGDGSGTVASSNGSLVLHANFASNQLTPGGNVPVSYTADNNNSSSLFLTSLNVTSVTVDSASATAGCQAGDFSATATATSPGTQVAAHSTGTAVGSGTLYMADTTANQDACQGATITINVSST